MTRAQRKEGSDNPIVDQLGQLLRLIYESDATGVTLTRDQAEKEILIFHGRNNGGISRGDGVHGAAMPALPFALGSYLDKVAGKNTLAISHIVPDRFIHDLEPPETLLSTRNKLLKYALGRFFISCQNHQFFVKNGEPHPISGKGATSSSNLCKSAEELLSGVSFDVTSNNEGNTALQIKEGFEVAKAWLADLLPGKEPEEVTRFTEEEVTQLLNSMLDRVVNYEGVIPVSDNGEIFLALRRNLGQKQVLGYATCGGHCNDPYHPELSAALDLKGEFGLPLEKDFRLSEIKKISKIGDVAVFIFDAARFKTSDFSPNLAEFAPNTAGTFSFKEMRDLELSLRAIPSIDLYLQNCQHRLNDLFQSALVKEISIPHNQVRKSGITTFPGKNFGTLEFYPRSSEGLQNLKSALEEMFGGEAEVDEASGVVRINDLNPKQIIDTILGKKTKADLEDYRAKQIKKVIESKAAATIQTAYREHLAHKRFHDKLGIDVKKRSKINLNDLISRLGPLEEEETEILSTLLSLPFFLFHCTVEESADAIRDQGKIKSNRTLSDVNEKLAEPIYSEAGMERLAFCSIGSTDFVSPYSEYKKDVFRMNFDGLAAGDRHFADRSFAAEIITRFFRPQSSEKKFRVGDTNCTTTYFTKNDDGMRRKTEYVRKDGSVFNAESSLGDYVCSTQDLRQFIAHMIIEEIRNIGGSVREYLIANPTDTKALSQVMDEVFAKCGFAMHVPTALQIDAKCAETVTFSYYKMQEIEFEMRSAIFLRDDTTKLDEIKAGTADFIYYCNSCCGFSNQKARLPLQLANMAMTHNNLDALAWLADNEVLDVIKLDFNLSKSASEMMQNLKSCFCDIISYETVKAEVAIGIFSLLREKGIFSDEVLATFPEISAAISEMQTREAVVPGAAAAEVFLAQPVAPFASASQSLA